MTARDLFARIRADLEQVRWSDRGRFLRELARLESQRRGARDIDAPLEALRQRVADAAAKVAGLREMPLRIEYDPNLPISAHRTEILEALARHQVIVLCGATGSGKSTQLPKLCLEAGRGLFGLIGHTQPRRLAARALANRLAEELQTSVGGAVGYQVRFTDHTGPDCRVKLMTDGILLRELEADRELRRYDTLLIDEAHERSLNIDLLLGSLQRLLQRRADLKLIVTSATIDPKKFADFFSGAPIIEVSGRSYPVAVRYRPLQREDEELDDLSLPQGVVAAVQELAHDAGRGDVLVFLPGEKQIREAAKALRDARLRDTEVLPLFARLSAAEQQRIFTPHTGRRVVLATNVAETSLTVPGIRFVVDSGLARVSRYSVRGKVQRLPIEKIARANAEQRKGRCGREAEGICIRLYAEDDFLARDEFTPPEILRTNLASVILKLAMLGLPEPADFAFLDAPELRQVNDGYRLLQELKAVDEARRITSLGRQIATLPLDPRLARMLLAASHLHCLREMLVIAAALSIQDPRERPQDAQQQADQHHASYADKRSDFLTMLILWRRFQEQAEALSNNQLRKWCREQFLSYMRIREWQEVHAQLQEAVDDLDLKLNQIEPNYAELHQAILSGFLGNIGLLEENREYLGARGTRFVIAPGTPLAGKPPKWVVAANLVETTRVYARMVAAVEPQWIAAAGEHLLKRTYSEPHWQAQRGFVAAYETAALYGLVLSARHRINYAGVAPDAAREIFVRAALVEGQGDLKAEFLEHNRNLQQRVEQLEARIRRRDLLVDEQTLVDFYLTRLPGHVHSAAAFNNWSQEPQCAAAIYMQPQDLLRREADFNPADYPDALDIGGNRLTLDYKFEPAEEDDGVTLTVPEPLLAALAAAQVHWCVPGWHRERITEVLRALPKSLRKAFVPVPSAAEEALRQTRTAEDQDTALAAWIARRGGTTFTVGQLQALSLPPHLQPWIRVVDLEGNLLAAGRDLGALQRAGLQRLHRKSAAPSLASTTTMRSWDIAELPEEREVEHNGLRYTVYPTLEARAEGVVPGEASTPALAAAALARAVLCLAMLALPQQYKFVRQQITANRELMLLGQSIVLDKPLVDALSERVFHACFLPAGVALPRTREAFDVLLQRGREYLHEVTTTTLRVMTELLREWREIRRLLATLKAPPFATAVADVEWQLRTLLPGNFLATLDSQWFPHLPRYLRAVVRRLQRLPGNAPRDKALLDQLQPALAVYRELSGLQHPQPSLERLRWMIEEFRVSLFAQDLRTAMPVSAKRLDDAVEQVKGEVTQRTKVSR